MHAGEQLTPNEQRCWAAMAAIPTNNVWRMLCFRWQESPPRVLGHHRVLKVNRAHGIFRVHRISRIHRAHRIHRVRRVRRVRRVSRIQRHHRVHRVHRIERVHRVSRIHRILRGHRVLTRIRSLRKPTRAMRAPIIQVTPQSATPGLLLGSQRILQRDHPRGQVPQAIRKSISPVSLQLQI